MDGLLASVMLYVFHYTQFHYCYFVGVLYIHLLSDLEKMVVSCQYPKLGDIKGLGQCHVCFL